MPELSSLGSAMLQFITGSITNPGLGLLFALIGGISMWALEALFYIRQILLYVYLYGMPIAFAIAYGNIPVLSDVAMGFSKRFVPLAIPTPACSDSPSRDTTYSTLEGVDAGNSVPQVSRRVFTSTRCALCHVEDVQVRDSADRESSRRCDQGAALIGGVAAGAYRRRRRRDDRRPVGPESRCGTRRCPEGSGPRFEQRRR